MQNPEHLNIWDQITTEVLSIRWQEIVSTLAQIISVIYARKNNILVYPSGIIGVTLAAWVYFFIAQPAIYADGIIHIYYLIMSIYGWINWTRKNAKEHELYPISYLTKKEWIHGAVLMACLLVLIILLLYTLTDSDTIYLDAIVASSAAMAMWWMAKRKIENWLAWIISNIVAIPLNIYKGFYLFALMYLLFLVLAVLGFKAWQKMIKK